MTGTFHMRMSEPRTRLDLPTPEIPLTSRCGAVSAGLQSMKPERGRWRGVRGTSEQSHGYPFWCGSSLLYHRLAAAVLPPLDLLSRKLAASCSMTASSSSLPSLPRCAARLEPDGTSTAYGA